MKVKVVVTLKSGVLDPQGKAIQQTLNGMGFANVKDVDRENILISILMKMMNKAKTLCRRNL